jgi:ElaB/YqjD/DUF883 family membrane-anchored ribosome-binding protein
MSSANADTLRKSTSDAVDQLQRAARPVLKEGKRQATSLLAQSGELLDSVGTQANKTGVALIKSLTAYTKKNPLTALAMAVGVGALFVGAKSMRSRR